MEIIPNKAAPLNRERTTMTTINVKRICVFQIDKKITAKTAVNEFKRKNTLFSSFTTNGWMSLRTRVSRLKRREKFTTDTSNMFLQSQIDQLGEYLV
ncbi:hypothetical protein DOY81_003268 [Sarcophaga bullata]|nr:hypothetical protein DOY81_003268 [Sarcophaga bullata]